MARTGTAVTVGSRLEQVAIEMEIDFAYLPETDTVRQHDLDSVSSALLYLNAFINIAEQASSHLHQSPRALATALNRHFDRLRVVSFPSFLETRERPQLLQKMYELDFEHTMRAFMLLGANSDEAFLGASGIQKFDEVVKKLQTTRWQALRAIFPIDMGAALSRETQVRSVLALESSHSLQYRVRRIKVESPLVVEIITTASQAAAFVATIAVLLPKLIKSSADAIGIVANAKKTLAEAKNIDATTARAYVEIDGVRIDNAAKLLEFHQKQLIEADTQIEAESHASPLAALASSFNSQDLSIKDMLVHLEH